MRDAEKLSGLTTSAGSEIIRLCADEELLPVADQSADLVVSNLALHWVNDLPGLLHSVFRVLKPDGLFLASMFGENTLVELRNSLLLAEQERDGGVSPHVSPFAGIGDVGNLLSRAGFALPTADQETLTVKYKDPFLLMHELQAMAEQNSLKRRKAFTSKETFLAAAAIYREMYGDAEGAVPATFQVLYLTGWSPHESQQKPKRRGSATKVAFSPIFPVCVFYSVCVYSLIFVLFLFFFFFSCLFFVVVGFVFPNLARFALFAHSHSRKLAKLARKNPKLKRNSRMQTSV